MKVGDLVRHRQHKTNRYAYWKNVYLVRWTFECAFQVVGDSAFFPVDDYEVISEAR